MNMILSSLFFAGLSLILLLSGTIFIGCTSGSSDESHQKLITSHAALEANHEAMEAKYYEVKADHDSLIQSVLPHQELEG